MASKIAALCSSVHNPLLCCNIHTLIRLAHRNSVWGTESWLFVTWITTINNTSDIKHC